MNRQADLYIGFADYYDYEAPGLCEVLAHRDFKVVDREMSAMAEASSQYEYADFYVTHYRTTENGSVEKHYKRYRKADSRTKTDRESGAKVIVYEWSEIKP